MGELKALRVEYEKFFNGALEVPPEELRGRLSSQIKRLRNSGSKSIADDFLLASLEAQFNSYNELFGRRLRIAEEGRGIARPVTPAERSVDATKGVVCRDGVEADAATALYQALEKQGPPRFDLDTFHTYLTRQLSAIREKTGCSAVHFRIAAEDGQLKLKARPVTTA